MLEREETAVKSTMDNLGAIMGGERALKLKKKSENLKCAQSKNKKQTNTPKQQTTTTK